MTTLGIINPNTELLVDRNKLITAVGTVSKKKKFKRKIFQFGSNHTFASKAEPDSIIKEISGSIKVSPFSEVVKQHAFQRLQIFYYQCLTYYKTNASVEIDKTDLQHGISSIPGMSAAHSAILPGLKDNLAIMSRKLYIKDMMAATMELPHIVNEVDCQFETDLREKAIKLINQCSQESLHPFKALFALTQYADQFFNKAFADSKTQTSYFNELKENIDKLNKIKKDENLGEFCLRAIKIMDLVSEEKNRGNCMFPTSLNFNFIDFHLIRTGFERYFQSSDKYFSQASTQKEFYNVVQSMSRVFQIFPEGPANPLHLLNVTSEQTIPELRSAAESFLSQISPFDLIKSNESVVTKLSALCREITPKKLEALNNEISEKMMKLNEGTVVLDLQKKGSTLPPFYLLSGTLENSTLRPKNEEELMEQQKELYTLYT